MEEEDDGGQDRDSSGDLMGLKGKRANKERDSTMDTATRMDSGETRQSHAGKKGNGKQWKGERKGENKEKRKGKIRKGWGWRQKGKGKEKGLQSVNVWEERDVTDEITSEPILSMGCGEIQPKTESPDPKMTPEEWQIPMKRVKSTCTKFRASNRKFV